MEKWIIVIFILIILGSGTFIIINISGRNMDNNIIKTDNREVESINSYKTQPVSKFEKATNASLNRVGDKLNITYDCNKTKCDYYTIRMGFYYVGDESLYSFADASNYGVSYEYWQERKYDGFKWGGTINMSGVSDNIKDNGYYLVFQEYDKSENVNVSLENGKLILDGKVNINYEDESNPNNKFKLYKREGGRNNIAYMSNNSEPYHGTIDYDPSVVIEEVTSGYTSNNIDSETNFTHISLSNTGIYENLSIYHPFDFSYSKNKTYEWVNNINSTFQGDAHRDTGLYGNAIVCDGNDDYIDYNDGNAMATNEYAVSFWLKFNDSVDLSQGGDQNSIIGRDSASQDAGWWFSRQSEDADNDIRFGTYTGNIKANINWGSEWHHVVLVQRSNTNAEIWVDGNLNSQGDNGYDGLNPFDRIHICYREADSGTGMHNGKLDDIMMFSDPIDSTQIKQIYNMQSDRFVDKGWQDFETNITSGNNTINVTSDYESNIGSKLNLTLEYYDGTWNTAGTQEVTGLNTFDISDTATNVSLNYSYYSGSDNGSYSFYSPLLKNDITLETYSTGADTTPPSVSIAPQLISRTNSSLYWNVTLSENANITGTYGEYPSYSGTGTFSNSTKTNYFEFNITNLNNNTNYGFNITNMCDSAGNCNTSGYTFNFTTEQTSVDSCSCPGLNTNWEIDLSDYCVIQQDCDIGTGNISWVGTGNITFNSTINANKIYGLPANQKGYLGSQAVVRQLQ